MPLFMVKTRQAYCPCKRFVFPKFRVPSLQCILTYACDTHLLCVTLGSEDNITRKMMKLWPLLLL